MSSATSARNASMSFGPVSRIDAGLLYVGHVDSGPHDGAPGLLLHGWPYDIEGGIGHDLPQEAPAAFAEAILDVGAST